jgi:hypothetical protein
MLLAFFDSKGLIYTNYMPRGTTVSANYIMDTFRTRRRGVVRILMVADYFQR